MTAEQQKAYDIGYKAATVGVALTGKVKIDRTAFVTNNYQAFGGDFSLASKVYDYYVKGYNQAKSDQTTASTPLPRQSVLTELIRSQYARLKKDYTSADMTNWLTQCANLWRQIPEPKNLDKLADKLVAMFNSLPPSVSSVVDNTQDYAPVIETTEQPLLVTPFTPEGVSFPTTTPNQTAEQPLLVTPFTPQGVSFTPEAISAQTPAASDIIDNVQDYAPVIASSSSPGLQPATNTADAARTKSAGMSSNVLIVLAIVGVFIGMLFFKGKK